MSLLDWIATALAAFCAFLTAAPLCRCIIGKFCREPELPAMPEDHPPLPCARHSVVEAELHAGNPITYREVV